MKKSILIAIPCYGGQMSDETGHALYQTAKQFERLSIRNDLLLKSNESLISQGRSNIANFFMNNTNHDFLMCIDSDIGFQPQDILKLLELDVEFSTGAYSMKTLPPKYNFGLSNDELVFNDNHTAFQISHIGTGFHLIKRSVFEKLSRHYLELKYIPHSHSYQISEKEYKNSFHFYQPFIDDKLCSLPEDISFCRRWKNCGGDIWLRPDIQLNHIGSHVFKGVDLTKVKI